MLLQRFLTGAAPRGGIVPAWSSSSSVLCSLSAVTAAGLGCVLPVSASPKPEGLRVQVEQGWNVQAWLWSSPAGGSRAVTCSSQDISDTASPLCETVPADENALRCVFAWRNWESVYLLVL